MFKIELRSSLKSYLNVKFERVFTKDQMEDRRTDGKRNLLLNPIKITHS